MSGLRLGLVAASLLVVFAATGLSADQREPQRLQTRAVQNGTVWRTRLLQAERLLRLGSFSRAAGDEEKIREGGCEAYIAKPISVTNFLETVERFLS